MRSPVITVPVAHDFDPEPLRAAIESQDLSQRELAAERGCHYVTLNRVLNGTANPSLDLVEWLCARLSVPLEAVRKTQESIRDSFLSPD